MPNDVINTVTVNGTQYDINGGGHTIKNPAGTAMTQRSNLQFVDLTVSDDSTNDATKVENIHVIQSESELENLPDGLYMLDDDEDTVIDGNLVGYDNTNSGLNAENAQDAIDEVVDNTVKKYTKLISANETYNYNAWYPIFKLQNNLHSNYQLSFNRTFPDGNSTPVFGTFIISNCADKRDYISNIECIASSKYNDSNTIGIQVSQLRMRRTVENGRTIFIVDAYIYVHNTAYSYKPGISFTIECISNQSVNPNNTIIIPVEGMTPVVMTENDFITASIDIFDYMKSTNNIKTNIIGNPISISELKSNQLAIDPIITLEPIQDLHGQSKPYPAGGGKNKLNLVTKASTQSQQVTYEYKADNTLVASGTSTGNADLACDCASDIKLKANTTYTISLSGSALTWTAMYLYFYNPSAGAHTSPVGCDSTTKKATYTTPNADMTFTKILLRIPSTYSCNINARIQIEEGTQATDYAPYENICPISGYDKVEALSCGKNLFDIDKVIRNSTISVSGSTITVTPVGYNTDLFSGNTGEAGVSAKKLYLKAGTYTISFSFVGTAPQLSSIYVNTIDENTLIPNGNIGRKLSGQSFTIPSNSWICLKLVTNGTCTLKDIQIEESTSATTYVPHVKTTSISESLGQTVYHAIDNVREGKLDVDSADYTLTGSETWTAWGTGAYYSNCLTKTAPSTQGIVNVFACEFAELKTVTNIYNGISGIAVANNNIYISGDIYASISSLTGKKLIYEITTHSLIQLTPHEISLLSNYAYVSTNGTNISLDYHNGEMASLSDVSQLGETVNALGDRLTAIPKRNEQINITSYNSTSNRFTVPTDGYITCHMPTSGNNYIRVGIYDKDAGTIGITQANKADVDNVVGIFVKRGMLAMISMPSGAGGDAWFRGIDYVTP